LSNSSRSSTGSGGVAEGHPNSVLLYTHNQSVKRLQERVASNVPADVSLVNELTTDRRAEAADEAN